MICMILALIKNNVNPWIGNNNLYTRNTIDTTISNNHMSIVIHNNKMNNANTRTSGKSTK